MTETIVTGGSPNELRRNSLGLIAVTFMVISGSVAMWLTPWIALSTTCVFCSAVTPMLSAPGSTMRSETNRGFGSALPPMG